MKVVQSLRAWAGWLYRPLRPLGPAGPLALAATIGPVLGVAVLIATAQRWLPLLDDGPTSALVYVPLAATAAAACLLPTHATSLLAGFVFGRGTGALVAWLVVVLGALLGHLLWRLLIGAATLRAIARSPRARRIHRELLGRGFWQSAWLITLLRLSPVMPFAATNLVFAALGLGLRTFLVATAVGITPRAVGAALIGAELSALDWNARGGGWLTALSIAATVLVLWVVGRAARAALRQELPPPADPA